MFDNEIVLNEFMVEYLKLLAQDLDEADLDRQSTDLSNPPRWILGHLAVYTDYAIRALGGGRFRCPKSWHRSFSRGTEARSLPGEVPSKADLLHRIVEGFAETRELCRTADPEKLASEHSVAFLKNTPLKTVGHIVGHLLTTHFAAHCGQLSSWRRAVGRPPVEVSADQSAFG